MSTLTVLLPPRDAALSPQAWQLPALRFVLTDRRGRTVRAGEAPLALLPPARATVLILAARDVLLVDAVVPPLAGPRLRQVLPNIVEDQLLPDGPPPHIALGPAPPGLRKTAARRTLAAIDRGWLRFLHESFTAAGHRAIRAVPIVACLPMDDVAPALAPAAEGFAAAGDAVDPGRDEASAPADAPLAMGVTVLVVGMAAAPATSGQRLREALAGYPPSALDDPADALLADAPTLGAVAYDGGLYEVGMRDGAPQVEVAIRRPLSSVAGTVAVASRFAGEGLAVPLDALADTLAALLPAVAGGAAGEEMLPGHEMFRLSVQSPSPSAPRDPLVPPALVPARGPFAGDGPSGAVDVDAADARLDRALRGVGVIARPMDFGALALAARESTFDLCQFEFAAQPWRLRPGVWGQLRLPLGLLAASVVVAVLGLNLQWRQLARERDAIQTRMTELLLEAFPRTSVVLDPAAQMNRSLDALRVAAGELSPDDFLSLSNGLAASLGAIPRTAIDSLDYDRQALQLAFRADATIDGDFRQRLARNGLDGSFDGKRWTIRSIR